jgi:hypothetical protein
MRRAVSSLCLSLAVLPRAVRPGQVLTPAAAVLAASCRCQSDKQKSTEEVTSEIGRDSGAVAPAVDLKSPGADRSDELSTAQRDNPADGSEVDEGVFDELEAVSQELHDVCKAMVEYARIACTRWDQPKFFPVRMSENVNYTPVSDRIVCPGQGAAGRPQGYTTAANLEAATKLYNELGAKAVQLLTPEAIDRLVHSAGKKFRDKKGNNRVAGRNIMARANWTKFPISHFKEAPYEMQQLRSDMPTELVLNARSLRDLATLRNLMTLAGGTEHPYRQQIESILWQHVEKWDITFRGLVAGPK